jgi:holo-[acyl-carrier protein] synthase
MIVGVGIDVAEIERFSRALRRTPALAERLFTERERGPSSATTAASPPRK